MEFASRDQGNKIYTIDAIELDDKTPAAQWVDSTVQADGLDPTSIRSAEAISNIARSDEVNKLLYPTQRGAFNPDNCCQLF
ncbi:MAG: hypothetical protein BVN35_21120 [Proteobacteria bacterium ST_bin11]|nr:MAG: hypothetical protein BVN35_21120 [Proteobacteria bacterium ST_bin11]